MYLVENSIVERMLASIPRGQIRMFARLSPSMKVIRLSAVVPILRVFVDAAVRAKASKLTGIPYDAEVEYEHYELVRTEAPIVYRGSNGGILDIYYPYKLIKEGQ